MIRWSEVPVYLHRHPVDFRKSINGLAQVVEQDMGRSPMERALFVFGPRSRDKVKVLYWHRTGPTFDSMTSIEILLREREAMQQHQAAQATTIEQLRTSILQLEECIRNGRRKQFGPSSENVGGPAAEPFQCGGGRSHWTGRRGSNGCTASI